MCSNYEPVTLNDRFMAHFGVVRPDDVEPPESAFPGLSAFFLRREDQVALAVAQVEVGFFGLLPSWAPDVAFGRKTYNCKAETMRPLSGATRPESPCGGPSDGPTASP
jgi:hypothetical protein